MKTFIKTLLVAVTILYETTITQSAWRRLFWPVL